MGKDFKLRNIYITFLLIIFLIKHLPGDITISHIVYDFL